jgi:hypothetical protein
VTMSEAEGALYSRFEIYTMDQVEELGLASKREYNAPSASDIVTINYTSAPESSVLGQTGINMGQRQIRDHRITSGLADSDQTAGRFEVVETHWFHVCSSSLQSVW